MQDTIVSTAKAGRPVWAYFNKDIHLSPRHPRCSDLNLMVGQLSR